MSVVGSQQRTLIHLLAQLRPHWRNDRNLPARIQTLLARNRSFGSRDRRLYRELIYATLRYLPWIEPVLDRDAEHAARLIAWLAADAPATENFRRTLIADWPACPSGVAAKAALLTSDATFGMLQNTAAQNVQPGDLLPSWLLDECPEAFTPPQIDALHTRAPLWLRVNVEAIEQVTAEFNQRGWRSRVSQALPTALQVLDEADVTKTTAFENGLFEIQDLASQLLLESAGINPSGCWLDACAGAGGKTLQLANLLGAEGRIDAFDIRRAALVELAARATRARLRNITILEKTPTDAYDGVLVDAPCTGSGTWRRAPHLKWTTTAQQIADAAATQRTLLTAFSERVRPGGRLFYATCSLNQAENEAVIADFLAIRPEFAIELPRRDFNGVLRGGGLTLLPALHNTDGFFIAALRRRL
jgi:16S rRNA (cytosine967-C5)-methyltransferase